MIALKTVQKVAIIKENGYEVFQEDKGRCYTNIRTT
jgi:hypothetical protein